MSILLHCTVFTDLKEAVAEGVQQGPCGPAQVSKEDAAGKSTKGLQASTAPPQGHVLRDPMVKEK